MDDFDKLCAELRAQIVSSYESGVTVEDAERLAAKFLDGQMQVADRLRDADLDARMRKSGIKSIKAAVYLEHASKSDKKPSDAFLSNIVESTDSVRTSQDELDAAEVEVERLRNYLQTFQAAHVHYRNISKGAF
jgi:hypothetical protein